MAREADIIIVGAGPSGLIAAIHAARKGAKVLVVDRKEVIGAPVHCGEGTFRSVLSLFDLDDGKWIVNSPSQISFHPPRGKPLKLRKPVFDMVILDRILWEQEMARRAKGNGVEILLEKTVVGLDQEGITLDDGKKLAAGLVIGCDGVESKIGRMAGLTKPLPLAHLGRAAQYRVETDRWDPDIIEMFTGNEIIPNGYAWVFPKGGKIFNVGVGYMGVNGPSPAIQHLDDFLKNRCPDMKILDKMAGCVPLGPPIETAVKGNVMLAGDAARHAYALGGAGIHSALLAGALAGDAAGAFIDDGQRRHLRVYDERWKKQIYKGLQKSYDRQLWLYSSEVHLERFVRVARIGVPFLRILPIDVLRLVWGKYKIENTRQ